MKAIHWFWFLLGLMTLCGREILLLLTEGMPSYCYHIFVIAYLVMLALLAQRAVKDGDL